MHGLPLLCAHVPGAGVAAPGVAMWRGMAVAGDPPPLCHHCGRQAKAAGAGADARFRRRKVIYMCGCSPSFAEIMQGKDTNAGGMRAHPPDHGMPSAVVACSFVSL